jgi:hypothetical protein
VSTHRAAGESQRDGRVEHVFATAERLEAELGPEQFAYDAGCQLDIEASPEPGPPVTVDRDGGYIRSRERRLHEVLESQGMEASLSSMATAGTNRTPSAFARLTELISFKSCTVTSQAGQATRLTSSTAYFHFSFRRHFLLRTFASPLLSDASVEGFKAASYRFSVVSFKACNRCPKR